MRPPKKDPLGSRPLPTGIAKDAFWHFDPAETRILAIDDDANNRDMLSRLLSRAGFPIKTASSGAEGLSLLPGWDPHLVVCDVRLPDMSGLEICSGIKKAIRTRHVFVALISSQETSSDSKIAGLGSGADEYITRPVNNRELVARIHALARIQQTSHALRRSEQRFLTLAQTAPVGITRTDPYGNIVYVNDAWSKITGLSPEHAQGKRWQLGIHPDDVSLLQKSWQSAAAKQRAMKVECRMVRRDGKTRWILTTASTELDDDGKTAGYIAAIIDITERKAAEEAVATLNQTLEKRVSDRTAQLAHTNEILLNEINEKKRAEEALRQLPHRILDAQETERRRVARELHDGVSQILASVRFRCRDIISRIADLEDPKLLRDIRQTEKYLDAALTEVRNISHDLRPSELDDLGLVSAIQSLVDHSRHRSKLQFEVKLPRLRNRLPAEIELALYRILQESISNIERHARAKLVSITLSKTRRSLILVIQDDGRGFASPGDRSRKRSGGLGLINIRERADFIDATVAVNSQPKNGTRIEVFVPLPGK